MRRPAFYSRSPGAPQDAGEPGTPPAADEAGVPAAAPAAAAPRWQPGRRSFALLLAICVGASATAIALWPRQNVRQYTQKDIDAAVLRTLQTATLPSPAAKAADIIRPSVVRVVGYGPEKKSPEAQTLKRGNNLAKGKAPEADEPPGEVERGVGTGVVIVDKGIILTNLHVVAGAEKIKVTFCRRPRSRRRDHRRAARERPRGAAGAEAARRPDAGHHALDRRPHARRQGGRGRLSLRHRALGVGRRGVGAQARPSARPRASRSSAT